ncbi:cbb3-type cytochrome c oxidase subunit 3 [Hyphobacterium marinum]|uniref:Cbb3-type cytochrome c oxidase subunit 3 n=1 Tax=Hyphobacterium marinum TaxID=3116574 RepID=A0ABU7LU44_9PROT|nr:cbb3-type cytochrome c oxidase subunit 3 [Hyphobacterium sp. Y6023]MEE2565076.1 cbb3-type cytochrome c oxidase subunit 3 [Hyphobacterium sp. Y6023]
MYESLSQFAQTGGLLIFIGLFGAVLAYALWPRNKAKFDAAARQPLRDDAEDEPEDKRDD